MAISYDYTTGQLSHFALVKVDGRCNVKPLVGVFCRTCGHYLGSKGDFIICGNPNKRDDEGAGQIRNEIYNHMRDAAFRALDC